MKTAGILLVVTAAMLGACSAETSSEPESHAKDALALGSDRDAHGCITSAGYQWCAKEKE